MNQICMQANIPINVAPLRSIRNYAIMANSFSTVFFTTVYSDIIFSLRVRINSSPDSIVSRRFCF